MIVVSNWVYFFCEDAFALVALHYERSGTLQSIVMPKSEVKSTYPNRGRRIRWWHWLFSTRGRFWSWHNWLQFWNFCVCCSFLVRQKQAKTADDEKKCCLLKKYVLKEKEVPTVFQCTDLPLNFCGEILQWIVYRPRGINRFFKC